MSGPAKRRAKLGRILKLLTGSYGPVRPMRRRQVVDVLIATILSQNTSGANSSEAFRDLKQRFATWDQAADAGVGAIRRCIRSGGLSSIKAPRIRKILRDIRAAHGQVSLEHLRDVPPATAYQYLIGFDGVGPKTALCVMLFALGMKVFPVDTHVWRITRRLGLLPKGIGAQKAHEHLTPLIPPEARYPMHLLLITHGREVCRARNPLCRQCVLLRLCPHARRKPGRVGAGVKVLG